MRMPALLCFKLVKSITKTLSSADKQCLYLRFTQMHQITDEMTSLNQQLLNGILELLDLPLQLAALVGGD